MQLQANLLIRESPYSHVQLQPTKHTEVQTSRAHACIRWPVAIASMCTLVVLNTIKYAIMQ